LAKNSQNHGGLSNHYARGGASHLSNRYSRGGASSLAKRDNFSKHIGALGGQKGSHPALGVVGGNATKAKAVPGFSGGSRPSFSGVQNMKSYLPFKGKGK
jgi:hypothetical protein